MQSLTEELSKTRDETVNLRNELELLTKEIDVTLKKRNPNLSSINVVKSEYSFLNESSFEKQELPLQIKEIAQKKEFKEEDLEADYRFLKDKLITAEKKAGEKGLDVREIEGNG